MQPDISFIVPTYNVAHYLSECLNSLLAVPVSKEIIVIDDGSTDYTPALLQTFFHQHDCITIVHQQNQGVSIARNKGIELATGRYIQFVDADDKLQNQHYYPSLIRFADEHAIDIVKTMIDYIDENSKHFFTLRCIKHRDNTQGNATVYSGEDYFMALINYWFPVVWDGFIRADWLKSTHARFPEHIYHSEDAVFLLHLFSSRPHIRVLDVSVALYAYRARSNSASHHPHKRLQSLSHTAQAVQLMMRYVNALGDLAQRFPEQATFYQKWRQLGNSAIAVTMINAHSREYKHLDEQEKNQIKPYFTPQLMKLMAFFVGKEITL